MYERAASYVYFMRPVGAEGPVKIGCSQLPESRLRDVSTWSPVPLEIVASMPGYFQLEWAFHQKFLHLHTHREWFAADPELTATIEAVRAGTFDVTSLPVGRRIETEVQRKAWSRARFGRAD